jgi:2-aminoadipate transaminase
LENYADRMAIAKGSTIREMAKLMSDPEIVSFAGGNPAAEAFPVEELIDLSKEVLKAKSSRILQYGVTEGLPEFKESVLEYVIRPKGVKADLDNLLTLTGSVQGFDFMSKVFLNPGDVMLAEGSTFTGALQSFRLFQAECVGVEMDDGGIIIRDLEAKMAKYRPKFFYCIPTFQNPTGKTLPLDRRQQVAELAAKYNVIVLEDDPYCDLRYRGEPVAPIKSFDKAGKVVMLNSFSKVLAPGLRVGTVIADPDIIAKMTVCKQCAVGFPNGLSEAMVDLFLRRGGLKPQLDRIVPIYRERCDAMVQGLVKYFPKGTKYVVPDGGMFLWIELPGNPENYSIPEILMRSLKEIKVAFVPGQEFCIIPGTGKNTMRLNFSAAPREKMDAGLEKLGNLLKEYI